MLEMNFEDQKPLNEWNIGIAYGNDVHFFGFVDDTRRINHTLDIWHFKQNMQSDRPALLPWNINTHTHVVERERNDISFNFHREYTSVIFCSTKLMITTVVATTNISLTVNVESMVGEPKAREGNDGGGGSSSGNSDQI